MQETVSIETNNKIEILNKSVAPHRISKMQVNQTNQILRSMTARKNMHNTKKIMMIKDGATPLIEKKALT